MTILLVHNYYQQTGGEDHSFDAEAELLASRGHRVVRYTEHNDQIGDASRLTAAQRAVWSRRAYRTVRALIRRERPAVMHCTNTFPLISPSVYYAARAEGIPVVQTLRNYRLACVNGLFYRDGHPCEDCLGRLPWRGVQHACYRSSRPASAVVAAMLTGHRLAGTWTRQVDQYIALSSFARDKYIEAGLPAARVAVKPNFLLHPPRFGTGAGGYALFVGRLTPEKGVPALLDAWAKLEGRIELKIVGDGPLADRVAEAAASQPGITWLGAQPLETVYALMEEAAMLIFPSVWYETFGRVGMEALAAGTPVIVSKIGAIAELVDPGRTGLHAEPGDAEDMARCVRWALDHPDAWARMRREARTVFEATYTADRNYDQLMAIYDRVLHPTLAAPASP